MAKSTEWPAHKAEYGILGFVVNPKLSKLALAVWDGAGDVGLHDLSASYGTLGSGYYGGDDDPATQITGLPRANTPHGVRVKGSGYGTSLYTALCLGANLAAEGSLRLETGGEGEGVCSDEHARSDEAAEWWRRAIRLGVADEYVDEIEDQRDISDEVGDINSCLDTSFEGHVDSVLSLEAEVTIERHAQTYMYRNAVRHNLVALAMPIGLPNDPSVELFDAAWEHVGDADGEVGTILAADIRGISKGAVRLLLAGCREAGASDAELGELYFRWEYNLDPSVPFKMQQLYLPFTPNGEDELKARRILEKTAFLREETGWSELASLP